MKISSGKNINEGNLSMSWLKKILLKDNETDEENKFIR